MALFRLVKIALATQSALVYLLIQVSIKLLQRDSRSELVRHPNETAYFFDITINAVSKLCLGLTSFPAISLRNDEWTMYGGPP